MNTTNTTTANEIKVGDIFTMSWGYDQTNVDAFQVVRVSPKGIFVREIFLKEVDGQRWTMSGMVVPVKDGFTKRGQWCGEENKPLFRRLTPRGDGFSIKGRYFASKWNGQPKYCSWYA